MLIPQFVVLATLRLIMNAKLQTKSSTTRTCTQSRVGGLASVMLTHDGRHVLTMLNTRRKGWYEVLGILLGLIVLGALVGAAFLIHANFPLQHMTALVGPRQQLPGNPWQGFGLQRYGRHNTGMMGYGGMIPFGGFFLGLVSLGLLALLVLGIIWLVRRLRTPQAVPVTPSCPKCGKPVQGDWSNCPHCGKKL